MKSIEDLISTLSEEELELHKELIAECRQREDENHALSASTQDNLKKIEKIGVHFSKNLYTVAAIFKDIGEDSKELHQKLLKEKLRNMPEDKFYNA